MNKSNNALVITWIGDTASEEVVKAVAEILIKTVTIPELLTIVNKDENAITAALLRSSDVTSDICHPEDARTSAVILIGKRFESTLTSTNGNYVPFTMALLKAISDAKKYHTEENIALMNAIEIIARMNKVPKIARMYHITSEAINVIQQVYHNTWTS